MNNNISAKKLFIFDLDGTLAESKSEASKKILKLLSSLLSEKQVAIISGGKFSQFEKQLISKLKVDKKLFKNLTIFPTNSTALYFYKGTGWKKIYEERLLSQEKNKIKTAFKELQRSTVYQKPKTVYDKIVEDRNTQITFSALGQHAPTKEKEKWNKTSDLRSAYISFLKKQLKEFEIKKGGLTSIDITRKGIDKSYGIRKILKELNIQKKDAVFVGDAFYKGGNDTPARKTGIDCIPVSGPKETEKIIIEALR